MGLPDLYPAQVGSPYTTLAAPYTTGEATMTVVDATKLPDAPNIVCLAGAVAGEFRYTGKDGNILQGVTALPGTPAATTWPAGTYAFRGIAAYDHASIVEHLTFQRSHIVEASLDLTTNHTYSGRVLEGAEAGENLVFGDLAVLAESGKFVKANPATLATLDGTIALVVSDTIAAGSQGMFLLRGLIRNDSWTFSPGKELYAGSGALTHEPPTTGTQIIRKVGTALTATIIEFNPSSTLHAEYLVSVLPVNTVSKDNGDVERKFWKDDFSVDSSSQYTGDVADFTWDTANSRTTSASSTSKTLTKLLTVQHHKFRWVTQFENSVPGIIARRHFNFGKESQAASFRIYQHDGSNKLIYYGMIVGTYDSGNYTLSVPDAAAWSNTIHVFDIVINTPTSISVYIDGVLLRTFTSTVSLDMDSSSIGFTCHNTNAVDCHLYEMTATPSISYSDDFSTDITERYQAVTGTVAYDDVNKRMTITAGAGVTAKTRLKSYTQLEGAYKRKLHLPATGTDGDVVAAYFGTDPTLESGFGIGAIRTAGAWNIATIDGATVTDTGTVIADLVDGDSFYVEVERDTTHGVVWYYVYESSKPTTASGKLFNTYQEIYDGFWFKNKGAAENSIAVSEIEDRAESIVGRTNVELTEEVFNSVTGEMETRTYFKPIHRGAMLETYHDGTQEVVGTTFIDDFNWDRSEEYTVSGTGSATWDVVNGRITLTNIKTVKANSPSLGAGYYFFRFSTGTERCTLAFYCGSTKFTYADGLFYPDGSIPILKSFTINNGDRVEVAIILESATSWTILAYNLTTGQRVTISSLEYGRSSGTGDGTFGINQYTTEVTVHLEYMCCIAAESTSANGIAACIPPIGGGGRYGVEESVYIPITPGTEIPVGSVVISPNAKSTVVGTALTTFAQTPAGVSASLEYATGTKACPGLSTAFAPAGRHRVKADRNTLTNIGVKGSAAGTSPTVYIDSLHVRRQEVA